MKTNVSQKVAMIWLVLTTVLLFSCTSGSEDLPSLTPTEDDATATNGSFKVKASIIDNEGYTITKKRSADLISLFVFDQNNCFYERIEVDIQHFIEQRDIQISCPNSEQVTVIAWGGSIDLSEITRNLTKGSPMNNFILKSSRSSSALSLPGDLFYGQVVILKGKNRSSVPYELILRRKTSSISLSTQGIEKEVGCSYTYKIKSNTNGFDYNGALTEGEIEYEIPAFFDKEGNLIIEKSFILPSTAITIKLYKDNELIFDIQKDNQQNLLAIKEGSEAVIELKYDTTVSAKLTIYPWAYVTQNIEF